MTTDTRARMLIAGSQLFRDQGFDGTGMRDVVARAGTARGAIYHHFPQGKTQLATEVIDLTGRRIASIIEAECAAQAPREAVGNLMVIVEQIMLKPDLRPGCPVAAIAFAADDPDGQLRACASSMFERWESAISECLVRADVAPGTAARFATLAIASVEGALFLSRAKGDLQPLRDVGTSLQDYLDILLSR